MRTFIRRDLYLNFFDNSNFQLGEAIALINFNTLKSVYLLSLCDLTAIQPLAAMVFVFNQPFQIKSNQY